MGKLLCKFGYHKWHYTTLRAFRRCTRHGGYHNGRGWIWWRCGLEEKL